MTGLTTTQLKLHPVQLQVNLSVFVSGKQTKAPQTQDYMLYSQTWLD